MAGRNIPVNTLLSPKAPNLLLAPATYVSSYQEQLNNALRIYFNELDNVFGALLNNSTGGAFIRLPYGAFQDNIDQTATANTATVIKLRTTDTANGVSVVDDSEMTVTSPGIYNLQWSGQFENTDNASHDVSVWIRVNGTDVVGSNSIVGMSPRYSAGNYFHTIAAWNYFVSLQANDYVELWWSTDDAQVTLQAYAAGTSPTRPTTASVIATLAFVSALTV
jgi:hypothetical protein